MNTHQSQQTKPNHSACCHAKPERPDYLLWCSAAAIALLYVLNLLIISIGFSHAAGHPWYITLCLSVFELVNTMWWGILLGILMVGILARIPRDLVMAILGTEKGLTGLLRATAAGLLLDLCSHGILMVGAKLYERGATNGQMMAFLIASPWNSFSLTLILISLVGLGWTLVFIAGSLLIALLSGIIFQYLSDSGVIPENPNRAQINGDIPIKQTFMALIKNANYSPQSIILLLWQGLKESRMVLRWVLFGVLLASILRSLIDQQEFAEYFGPSLLGLGLTLVAATLIEVCSEGSTPIAADLLTRAQAPGNSFAFLMTGVATDYTEIMVIKETTKSWRIALLLPAITVPQIITLALLMN